MGAMIDYDLQLTGNPDADRLLSTNPLALVMGSLLDQQVPMESAFAGPQKLYERIGSLEAETIAAYDPDEFLAVFRQSPAVHRFPGSMAQRVQNLASVIVDEWAGKAERLWTEDDPTGAEVLKRLKKLPGFGEQKAKVFLALLGKQCGFTGDGWQDAAEPYGDETVMLSIADVTSPETLQQVRDNKKAAKATAKKK